MFVPSQYGCFIEKLTFHLFNNTSFATIHSRNILEQRRIDAEIRLAKARDHLFRKRQELAKISPKESLHSNYEEFGKESAVRGELMAAVTASIEARAMENECNNLDNVLKERGSLD